MRGLTLSALCLLVVVAILLGHRATPSLEVRPSESRIAWPLDEKENHQVMQMPFATSNAVVHPDVLLD